MVDYLVLLFLQVFLFLCFQVSDLIAVLLGLFKIQLFSSKVIILQVINQSLDTVESILFNQICPFLIILFPTKAHLIIIITLIDLLLKFIIFYQPNHDERQFTCQQSGKTQSIQARECRDKNLKIGLLKMLIKNNTKFVQIIMKQNIKINENMQTPLCKITFGLAEQQAKNTQNNQTYSATNTVQIYPGMTTYEIAECIGRQIGCGYHSAIEDEVKNQLANILRDGNTGVGNAIGDEEVWRDNMEKVLGIQTCEQVDHLVTPHISQKRFNSKYFQVNYDKFFKTKSHKIFNTGQKQNTSGIYERSIAKKKRTQQKLSMIKRDKQQKQIVECTFSPNISNTLDFFNKKNPAFFKNSERQKENIKNNTFEKLYKNAFDIKEKKSKRLRTLQNEEQTKLSEFSFIPSINECSREICRMKSYASFVSELSQIHQKQQEKVKQKIKTKEISKQNTAKKKKTQNCTFQPEISENTKRMTKNLPGFYERLERSQEKNRLKEDKSSKKVNNIVNNARNENRINKIVLKKQIYTIDDGSEEMKTTDQLQTQKKPKITKQQIMMPNVYVKESVKSGWGVGKQIQSVGDEDRIHKIQVKSMVEKRSGQLFNNRKKTILERIAKYFTISPPIKVEQFSKNKKVTSIEDNTQIQISVILSNPYIPQFVKEIISPITQQLEQANLSLTQQQFVWALQTLFEGLNLADRGSFLGWGVKLLPQNKNV